MRKRVDPLFAPIALCAVLSGLPTAKASPAGALVQAVAPAAAAAQVCAWGRASIGERRFGDRGFIDTAALYLVMGFGYIPGHSLRIRGLFPHARYMSITLYGGRALAVIDHLVDRSILPDQGSANPFRPYANRQARRRSYTLYVQQGAPPQSGRASNTLYTGPYHPVVVMYRVYAPDRGADDYGAVPAPHVDILDGPPSGYSTVTPLSACPSPSPLFWTAGVRLKTALQWQRIGARGGNGANDDAAYLYARLDREDTAVYVVRFKEPSYAATAQGRPITGHENVRLWSVCQYNMVSERVIACLHDDEAVRSRGGYVTIYVSTRADRLRPPTATRANGINWLPFGTEQTGLLVYRQILPNPSFQGSLKRVPPDALPPAMQRLMGPYFPTIQVVHVLPG